MIFLRGIDVGFKKKKINKILYVDEEKSFVSKLSYKNKDGILSEEDENMEKIIDEIDRMMDN